MAKILAFALPVTAQSFPIFPDEPDDNSTVSIRVATVNDMNLIQVNLSAETKTINKDDSITLGGKPYTQEEDHCYKAYLLMADCNLERLAGVPLFSFKDGKNVGDYQAFKATWGLMPIDWSERIFDCIIKANPTLDPKALAK